MAPRANWKGFLKVGELTCQVSLFTAASTSERIAFHTLNRKTGHRLRRIFVDRDTGKPVEADDQVKGYEVGQDDYVVLEPDEIAAAVPESDKTLNVQAFIACSGIDTAYFDRPYYLAPANPAATEAFSIIREGMRAKKVAALAQAVLFRRVRTLLIRPLDAGLVADTLNFDYEVRASQDTFSSIAEISIEGEMLDLAKHIIATKRGRFDPREFDDRYEDALADLVRAKIEGRPLEQRKPPVPTRKLDLIEALRQSAGKAGETKAASRKPQRKKPAPAKAATTRPRRKAS